MVDITNEAVFQDETQKAGGRFGKLGLDVGIFGRWSRLLWGIALLLPLAFGGAQDLRGSASSMSFYGLAALYFLAIGAAYVSVYWSLGERIFARANPWLNTAVFVGPAFAAAWWEILIEPSSGFGLPSSLPLAMTVYIGASFILQWKIKYGGCEVVALPIILSKRRYTTYCIPLIALDAVEKVVVERVLSPPNSSNSPA